MPSSPPPGEPVPADGALPASALADLGDAPFGVYVHVPFCTVRCGYCDFNTYTAAELGPAGGAPGASRATYAEAAVRELALARRVLAAGERSVPPAATVFVGGGTPTLLDPADLARVLRAVDQEIGLADDVEVTTEANPDSVTADGLARLREAGYTRISYGMQSAVPAVLATLDRTHDPERVATAVGWAREAGFEEVSLDLIYGTPGETQAQWTASVDAALACAPDHVSAYALVIEEGTAMHRQVARGLLPAPDDDDLAEKYLAADERLAAAGLEWYEVSNWARRPESRCRHNLGYWRGADWWGVGPGAHGHVGGVRWWNRRHPAAWAQPLAEGGSPAEAREVLDDETRRVERVLLELRLREGLDPAVLDEAGRAAVPTLRDDGLLEPGEVTGDRLVLTPRGRLLADAAVRALLP